MLAQITRSASVVSKKSIMRPIRQNISILENRMPFVTLPIYSFADRISRMIRLSRPARPREGFREMPSAEKEQSCVHIRWMIRRDMSAVLDIESHSFEFPWSEDEFIRALRQRNCIGMVAELNEIVVGFMIYELHKNRLHILNFAVNQDYRRDGVGRSMVEKLVSKLSYQRRSRILLEVRETNLPAQLFFKNVGFQAVSVLRDFYEDTTEDAYVMQLRHQAGEESIETTDAGSRRMAG